MNKKLKADWVAALRSGKYIQGKYRLTSIKTDHAGFLSDTPVRTFCCLGVLAKVAGNTIKEIEKVNRTDQTGTFQVCKLNAKTRQKLAHMNDQQNKSFEQIAKYIVKNL